MSAKVKALLPQTSAKSSITQKFSLRSGLVNLTTLSFSLLCSTRKNTRKKKRHVISSKKKLKTVELLVLRYNEKDLKLGKEA